MADVARDAGVSQQTVSRAINNKGEISEGTKRRVLRVANRLGFRPSAIARSLATHQTTAIGLVVPDIANPFFSQIARGVEDIANSTGYSVFVCNTDEDQCRESSSLDSLLERRVDGLILCSSRLPHLELSKIVNEFRFAVLINCELRKTRRGIGTVLVDDEDGTRQVIALLVTHGHCTIGLIAGPQPSWSGRNRMQGYKEGLTNAGLNIDPALIVPCQPDIDTGREAARRLLQARPDITALVAYNDLVAVGALQACKELGRQVPHHVAIVGCDDIPLASLVTPALTTLRVPERELGSTAMRALIETMQEEPPPNPRVRFTPELVVRDSAP